MAEFDGPLGDNAEFEINFTSLQDGITLALYRP